MPVKTPPQTLHAQIYADLQARIKAGEWPPGYRIPYEHELMATYKCSRMTVSKAVSALAEAGYVLRRKRAGSFVAEARLHAVIVTITDLQAEITKRGDTYGFRVLNKAIKKTAPNMPGVGKIFALTGLHMAGGAPFALEQRVVSMSAVPDIVDVDFSLVSPGSWLLAHVPWSEAEHRISAINVEPEVAKILAIDKHMACLAVDRTTWRNAKPVTYVRTIFPGIKYDLTAHFLP